MDEPRLAGRVAGMDDAEQAQLVEEIAARLRMTPHQGAELPSATAAAVKTSERPSVIKNAGEAIGLIAGVVAVAYVLGGLAIVGRLLFDGFQAEEAVGV